MLRIFSLAVLLISANLHSAIAGEFGCPACRGCGGACVLKATPVVEEQPCYDVECKDVCIPAVRFPWDSCRTPKCGRLRVVSRLKIDSRETRSCQYEWVPVCPRCEPLKAGASSGNHVPPAPIEPSPKPPAPPAAAPNETQGPSPEAQAAVTAAGPSSLFRRSAVAAD